MVIPQSERKSISFSISYKTITMIIGSILSIIFLSSVIVLNYSSRDHEIYELKDSNEDFIVQSQKLKSELKTLHEVSNQYYDKISSLHKKLGGDPNKSYPIIETDPIQYLEPNNEIFLESYRLQTDIYNIKVANQLTEEIIATIKDKKSIIQNTPSLWPTKGYILHPFGKYFSPIAGSEIVNNGIDIGAFPGTEVVATAPGLVYDIGYSILTGHYIKISHKYGWKTIYSNLERLQIKKGQYVSKGEIVGYVGKTPSSPIYHLHYEVHVGTSPLNPYSFLNQIQN
ncbi:MAG: M23 family metallopeptidase [Leptospiraceae bacterium]|nr:M23 family metallopeptidase [Leptospiraceae bacterium]